MSPPPGYRVSFALAFPEARRLVRSVAFVLFLPISVWAMLTATNWNVTWAQASVDVALGLVPLAWCLLVLTDLAVLRDRRHGVNVLTDTLPASTTARTGGHLLSGLVGVPVGIVLIAIFVAIRSPLTGFPSLIELAVPLLLIVGAAVVGVAVARWLPWALMTVPAIIVTIVITGRMGDSEASRVRFLGFVADHNSTSLAALEMRPTALHLVWLASWTAIMAVVALARSDRSPALLGGGTALVVTMLIAGVGQVRAVDDTAAAARADLLNQPTAHQTCTSVDNVTYCAYPGNGQYVERWIDTAGAIRERVPDRVTLDGLRVDQRVPWISSNPDCGPSLSLQLVDTPIANRVAIDQAWSADGQVHPGIADEHLPCGGTELNGLFTAVQIGAWAVGLPPAQWQEGQTCAADGQARSVIALWLGTANGGQLSTFVRNVGWGADGRIDLDEWDDQPPWGVDWHPSDLAAAIAVTAVSEDQVAAVLEQHWEQLVDPRTPTAELLELLELPGPATINDPLDTCAAP